MSDADADTSSPETSSDEDNRAAGGSNIHPFKRSDVNHCVTTDPDVTARKEVAPPGSDVVTQTGNDFNGVRHKNSTLPAAAGDSDERNALATAETALAGALVPQGSTRACKSQLALNVHNPVNSPTNFANTINNNFQGGTVTVVNKQRVKNVQVINKNKYSGTSSSAEGETDHAVSCDEETHSEISKEMWFKEIIKALDNKRRVLLSAPPGPQRTAYISTLRRHFGCSVQYVTRLSPGRAWGRLNKAKDKTKDVIVIVDTAFGVARLDNDQYHTYFELTSSRNGKRNTDKFLFVVYPHILSELKQRDLTTEMPLLKSVQTVELPIQPPHSLRDYYNLFVNMLRDPMHGEALRVLFASAVAGEQTLKAEAVQDYSQSNTSGQARLLEHASLLKGFVFSANGTCFADRVFYEAAVLALHKVFLDYKDLPETVDSKFVVEYVRTTELSADVMMLVDSSQLIRRIYRDVMNGQMAEIIQHPCLSSPQFLQQFENFFDQSQLQRLVSKIDDQHSLPLLYWSVWVPSPCLTEWCVGLMYKLGLFPEGLEWNIFVKIPISTGYDPDAIISAYLALALRMTTMPHAEHKDIWEKLRHHAEKHRFFGIQLCLPLIAAHSRFSEYMNSAVDSVRQFLENPSATCIAHSSGCTQHMVFTMQLNDDGISVTFPSQEMICSNSPENEEEGYLRTMLHLSPGTGRLEMVKVRKVKKLEAPQVEEPAARLTRQLEDRNIEELGLENLQARLEMEENYHDEFQCRHFELPWIEKSARRVRPTPLQLPTRNPEAPQVQAARVGLTPLQLATRRRAQLKKSNVKDRTCWQALTTACETGDTNQFMKILCQSIGVDDTDRKMETALHYVSFCGTLQMASILIDEGADVNARNYLDRTPLYVACSEKRLGITRLLVSKGADVNVQTTNRDSPLHIVSELGDKDLTELLLAHNADVSLLNDALKTPLDVACEKKQWHVAELLLQHDADSKASSKHGFTLLHKASYYGDTSVIDFLLHHKVDVNKPATRWRGDERKEEELRVFRCRNRKYKYLSCETTLRLACSGGHDDVVKLLLSHGARVNDECEHGVTALHVACDNGFQDIIGTLIQHKACIIKMDHTGTTPLHIACKSGDTSMLTLLLQHTDLTEYNTPGVESPLHVGCTTGRSEIVELLLQNHSQVNLTDEEGQTPLHNACRKGHLDIVKMLLDSMANSSCLTPLHMVDKQGRTPLHCACLEGHADVVRVLMDTNADINLRDGDGRTPLHYACARGFKDVIDILFEHGADYTIKDAGTSTDDLFEEETLNCQWFGLSPSPTLSLIESTFNFIEEETLNCPRCYPLSTDKLIVSRSSSTSSLDNFIYS